MKLTRTVKIRTRNPSALNPLMKKGGPHHLKNKRAKRALQKRRLRKVLAQEL